MRLRAALWAVRSLLTRYILASRPIGAFAAQHIRPNRDSEMMGRAMLCIEPRASHEPDVFETLVARPPRRTLQKSCHHRSALSACVEYGPGSIALLRAGRECHVDVPPVLGRQRRDPAPPQPVGDEQQDRRVAPCGCARALRELRPLLVSQALNFPAVDR
jgi:hypothetical protein